MVRFRVFLYFGNPVLKQVAQTTALVFMALPQTLANAQISASTINEALF